jgi:hypothetical protein
VKQVCDPNTDAEQWIGVSADSDLEAVHEFLAVANYDPLDYDPLRTFHMLVRDSAEDEPRKVAFRVVPTHFEVGSQGSRW